MQHNMYLEAYQTFRGTCLFAIAFTSKEKNGRCLAFPKISDLVSSINSRNGKANVLLPLETKNRNVCVFVTRLSTIYPQ